MAHGIAGTPVVRSVRGRRLSLLELAIGSFIVIGHNVFHLVPNEVPILFVLGILSICLREGSFRAIGLGRPCTWWHTILIALGTAVAVIAIGQFVTEPLAKAIGLHSDPGRGERAGRHEGQSLDSCEGSGWCGHSPPLARRSGTAGICSDARRTSAAALPSPTGSGLSTSRSCSASGPAGVFTTACDGFVIGAAYLLSGRNLWVAVLAHGLTDTIGIVLLFFGLAD